MFKSTFLLSFLLTSYLSNAFKFCDDCMSYLDCTEAKERAEADKSDATRQLFVRSYCGMTSDNKKVKVCCSLFKPPPTTTTTPHSTSTVPDIIESRVFVPNENSPWIWQENLTTDTDIHSRNFDNSTEHKNINLLPRTCGDIYESRIVGGTIASMYEFPWMALISYYTDTGLDFQCSGTLINSRYILTAAHCVVGRTIAGVRLGEYDLRFDVDCQGKVCEDHIEDVRVENETVHEKYKGHPHYLHDIALLRLQTNVNMSYRNVRPICLPVARTQQNCVITNKQATVTGWGLTEYNRYSSVLRKVIIPVSAKDICQDYYSQMGNPDNSQLCAGVYKKDSCQGDSGGPLMIEGLYRGSWKFVQYGIVSHGPLICGSHSPGIYTDVRKYMDWILDNIKE